jgi:hypothetical protein
MMVRTLRGSARASRSSFRYAPSTIAADYARSAIGLTATLGPLVLLDPVDWLAATLLAGAALFLAYAARALNRHSMRIELDEIGMRVRALARAELCWEALRSISLNYYSTRMDRSTGWMELVLRAAGSRIRVESDLPGFERLVAAAVGEAVKRNLPLDERSLVHLAALGIEPHAAAVPLPALLNSTHHA